MVFSCDYDKLVTNLQDIADIVEDPLAAEGDKSIIFKFHKDENGNTVRLIGISPVIIFKRSLSEGDYHLILEDTEVDDNGDKLIMIKSRELLNFLNSYKSLRKTKVDELIFEQSKNKIKCSVIESLNFTKEEIDKINQELSWDPSAHDPREEKFHSSWTFDIIPIKQNRLSYINIVAPDVELQKESGMGEFKLLSKSMIPIVDNSSTMYGSMDFDTNWLVAFNQAYVAFMCNVIPGDAFKGIKLSYRTLSFINKIISSEEDIQFARIDKYIYFKTKSSEAFIVYDTKLTPYETQLKMFNANHMVSVDRAFLKDILKRFKLINDSIEITIDSENSIIKMKNSKFEQEIPILNQKDFNFSIIHFKIMPNYLDGAIIGEDGTFNKEDDENNGQLFIYYNDANNVICLGDCTKIWFTLLSVQVY